MVNQLPVPVFEAKPFATHLHAIAGDDLHLRHASAILAALAADPIIYGMSQDLMLLCSRHPDPESQHALLLCQLVQAAGGCAAVSASATIDFLGALTVAATTGRDQSPAAYAARIRALCERIDPLNEWLMYQTWHASAAASPSPELLDTALTMVGDAHAKLDTATCIIATFDEPTPIAIENQSFRVQIGSLAVRVAHASVRSGVYGASTHISWDADGRGSTPSAYDLDLAGIRLPSMVDRHTCLDRLYRVVLQRVHE